MNNQTTASYNHKQMCKRKGNSREKSRDAQISFGLYLTTFQEKINSTQVIKLAMDSSQIYLFVNNFDDPETGVNGYGYIADYEFIGLTGFEYTK